MNPTEKQIPLPPAAGFVAVVEGAKPERVGERMMACLGMSDLTYRERCVLAAFASFDGPGGCWPAEATIADMLGVCRQRVAEAKEALRRKGRLAWKRGHGSGRLSCAYRLAYDRPFQSPENPDIGKAFQSPGFQDIDCPGFQDMNKKEPRASRSASNKEAGPDLCRYATAAPRRGSGSARPATCRHALGVEVGEKCLRCGWHREAE